MTQQGRGTISANDLMKKLVGAKKLINKVESGDYETGYIDENVIKSEPEDLIRSMRNQPGVMPMTQPVSNPTKMPPSTMSEDKIRNSNLPDAIKEAMIKTPIPQISLNDSLDMDFVKGAKRLMEAEGLNVKKTKQPNKTTQSNQQEYQPQPTYSSNNYNNNSNSNLINELVPIIENIIRKTLDEKLNQILSAQQTLSINENLVLKVGDSIFKGKITGVNKAK